MSENIPPHIAELNAEWFVVIDGSKTRVVRFAESEINGIPRHLAEFLTCSDFNAFYMNRLIRVSHGENEPDTFEPLGKVWLCHRQRRQYTGLIFDPKKPQEFEGKYNLWRGFAIKPQEGDWSLTKKHIKEVIADNNKEVETYVLNWLAFLFQFPELQAEVALALIGGKGFGKGFLGNMLCRIFGQHGIHISTPNHLTGRFNAHQRDCCFLFADESYWYGNKLAAGALQRLITEPDLAVEGKGKDIITVPNRMHVMLAAEEGSVVPAGKNERRYVVLHLNGKYAQQKAYFTPLFEEMKNGGCAAMLYDLLHNRKLEGWHPREIIHTSGIVEQQNLNLDALEAWGVNLLQRAQLPGAGSKDPSIAPSNDWEDEGVETSLVGGEVSFDTPLAYSSSGRATRMRPGLYSDARKSSPKLRDASDNELATFLKDKMGCTPVWHVGSDRGRGRGWKFPLLADARKEWEKTHPGWQWQEECTWWEPL